MRYLPLFIALGIGVRLLMAPITFQKIQLPQIPRSKSKRHQFTDIELMMFLSQFRQTLVAGQPIGQAISTVASGFPAAIFENTVGATRTGLPVLASFEADVQKIGHPTLLQLMRIIKFNQDLGAAINQPLEHLIETVKDREKRKELIESELAGVRATVIVLAMLPVLGVALGTLMGVNLIYWLLFEPLGRCLLVCAGLLELCGIFWVKRLIRTHS